MPVAGGEGRAESLYKTETRGDAESGEVKGRLAGLRREAKIEEKNTK